MRLIRYAVAMSLDGYIAGPGGEFDWIEHEPEIDFKAIWAQFDTLLMGRRTYDLARQMGKTSWPGMKAVVFSRTLRPEEHPSVTVMASVDRDAIEALRAASGKDLWLFGGGELCGSFLEAGLVDQVEVSIVPVVLGQGLPLVNSHFHPTRLKLLSHQTYSSGRVSLVYAVKNGSR
jgi:dihydrofolate reductase